MTHIAPSRYEARRSKELEQLLRFEELCRLLGVSRKTLYRLVDAGELTPIWVGKRRTFLLAEVREYLERQKGA